MLPEVFLLPDLQINCFFKLLFSSCDISSYVNSPL